MFMRTIFALLASERNAYDPLFAVACRYAFSRDWDAAVTALSQLSVLFAYHVRLEEQLVFAAYDDVVGSMAAATTVLRAEHSQLGGVLQRMADSLATRDRNAFLEHAGTMRLVLQLHKEKEEIVFYPMAETRLASQSDRIYAELATEFKKTT